MARIEKAKEILAGKWSWDNLARNEISPGYSLQDYWRDQEDNLVAGSDGQMYTKLHLPPLLREETGTLDFTQKASFRDEVRKIIQEYAAERHVLDLSGVALWDELEQPLNVASQRILVNEAIIGGGISLKVSDSLWSLRIYSTDFGGAFVLEGAEIDNFVLINTMFQSAFSVAQSTFVVAAMHDCHFCQFTNFSRSTFKETLLLEKVKFDEVSRFGGVKLLQGVHINGVDFHDPDRLEFFAPLLLSDTDESTADSWFRLIAFRVDSVLRLGLKHVCNERKQIAEQHGHAHMAHRFNGYFLSLVRRDKSTPLWESFVLAFYDIATKYGRTPIRPLVSIGVAILVSASLLTLIARAAGVSLDAYSTCSNDACGWFATYWDTLKSTTINGLIPSSFLLFSERVAIEGGVVSGLLASKSTLVNGLTTFVLGVQTVLSATLYYVAVRAIQRRMRG